MQTRLGRLTRVEGTVPLSLRAGWGIGALGVALLFNTYATILLFYLTRVAGVAVLTAGTLLMIAKAYDFVTDLPMGIISDRTQEPLRSPPALAAGGRLRVRRGIRDAVQHPRRVGGFREGGLCAGGD